MFVVGCCCCLFVVGCWLLLLALVSCCWSLDVIVAAVVGCWLRAGCRSPSVAVCGLWVAGCSLVMWFVDGGWLLVVGGWWWMAGGWWSVSDDEFANALSNVAAIVTFCVVRINSLAIPQSHTVKSNTSGATTSCRFSHKKLQTVHNYCERFSEGDWCSRFLVGCLLVLRFPSASEHTNLICRYLKGSAAVRAGNKFLHTWNGSQHLLANAQTMFHNTDWFQKFQTPVFPRCVTSRFFTCLPPSLHAGTHHYSIFNVFLTCSPSRVTNTWALVIASLQNTRWNFVKFTGMLSWFVVPFSIVLLLRLLFLFFWCCSRGGWRRGEKKLFPSNFVKVYFFCRFLLASVRFSIQLLVFVYDLALGRLMRILTLPEHGGNIF